MAGIAFSSVPVARSDSGERDDRAAARNFRRALPFRPMGSLSKQKPGLSPGFLLCASAGTDVLKWPAH